MSHRYASHICPRPRNTRNPRWGKRGTEIPMNLLCSLQHVLATGQNINNSNANERAAGNIKESKELHVVVESHIPDRMSAKFNCTPPGAFHAPFFGRMNVAASDPATPLAPTVGT